jgi:hypothetical protein
MSSKRDKEAMLKAADCIQQSLQQPFAKRMGRPAMQPRKVWLVHGNKCNAISRLSELDAQQVRVQ